MNTVFVNWSLCLLIWFVPHPISRSWRFSDYWVDIQSRQRDLWCLMSAIQYVLPSRCWLSTLRVKTFRQIQIWLKGLVYKVEPTNGMFLLTLKYKMLRSLHLINKNISRNFIILKKSLNYYNYVLNQTRWLIEQLVRYVMRFNIS